MIDAPSPMVEVLGEARARALAGGFMIPEEER
jgi:hypothetical protein